MFVVLSAVCVCVFVFRDSIRLVRAITLFSYLAHEAHIHSYTQHTYGAWSQRIYTIRIAYACMQTVETYKRVVVHLRALYINIFTIYTSAAPATARQQTRERQLHGCAGT